MSVLTYINFRRLDGDELNEDFKRFCLANGMTEETKFSVCRVPCVTGHDSYIINFD